MSGYSMLSREEDTQAGFPRLYPRTAIHVGHGLPMAGWLAGRCRTGLQTRALQLHPPDWSRLSGTSVIVANTPSLWSAHGLTWRD